jgi:hypothetical protein
LYKTNDGHSSRKLKPGKCDNYGKMGHWAWECPMRPQKITSASEESIKGKAKEMVNLIQIESSDERKEFNDENTNLCEITITSLKIDKSNGNPWFLYSSASKHITR